MCLQNQVYGPTFIEDTTPSTAVQYYHHRPGFIERVDHHCEQSSVHYIPHHPVRKESCTTPIRIVYDCRSKQPSEYPSLNDCLHPGPPFLNDLCGILLCFRQDNMAFSFDNEKAFLQVHLDIDRVYQVPMALQPN